MKNFKSALKSALILPIRKQSITSISDITDRYDTLTGLYDRASFFKRLQSTLNFAKQYQHRVSLLHIDLKNLKQLNSWLGYETGDLAVNKLVDILTEIIRQQDIIGRISTDEFIILINNSDNATAHFIAQKLHQRLQEAVLIKQHEVYLTIQIGLAVFPDTAETMEELISQASTTVLNAITQTPLPYKKFCYTNKSYWIRHSALSAELLHAIQNNQLSLVYQPIIDCQTEAIKKVEVLARWKHPKYGTIFPSEFISLIEELKLFKHFNAWLIDRAAHESTQFDLTGSIKIAINIPANHCQHAYLANQIKQSCLKHGIAPDQFEVEITESMLMQLPDRSIDILNQLKQLGIGIAIDDFGTEYSSLSYLAKLPFTVLKIDQTFLKDVPHNTKNCNIIQAIIALAHNLGLKIVIEGVENISQWAFVKEAGADYCQGYLFYRPLELSGLQTTLKTVKNS